MRVCLLVDPFLRITNKKLFPLRPPNATPATTPLFTPPTATLLPSIFTPKKSVEIFFAFFEKIYLHMIDKAYVLFYNKITFGLFSLNFWFIFNKLYQK